MVTLLILSMGNILSADFQKVLLLPMEATGILGSRAGVAELARVAMARQPSQAEGSPRLPPRNPPPRSPQPPAAG